MSYVPRFRWPAADRSLQILRDSKPKPSKSWLKDLKNGAQLGGHFLSMSQVFVASLLANSEGSEGSDAAGSVSVKVRNLPGEELCNFQMQGETLQDLKRELSDPQGPMSKRLRTSSLNFTLVPIHPSSWTCNCRCAL